MTSVLRRLTLKIPSIARKINNDHSNRLEVFKMKYDFYFFCSIFKCFVIFKKTLNQGK